MELFKTNNPVPSNDPRDLDDNAKVIDRTVTGTEKVVYDRLGQPRFSIQALHSLVLDAQAEVAPTVNQAKQAVTGARDTGVADIQERVQSVNSVAATARSDISQVSTETGQVAATAQADMLKTAANLGADLNNKNYTKYADMLKDAQTRDAVVGVVDGDPDASLNGWYRWNNTTKKWVRFLDQPVLESRLEDVTEGIQKKDVRPMLVPFAFDESGNVPIWFANGDLEVKGIGPETTEKVITIAGTRKLDVGNRFVPLAVDESGNAAVWLEDGNLSALGLSDSLKKSVGADRSYAPANQPVSSSLPNATDGRSMYAWRSRQAQILSGAGQARVLITGDSWTEYVAIPQRLATLLRSRLGSAGYGWVSVNGIYMLDGATLSKSGWTLYDASTGAVPVYGTGIDGMYISTDSAAATLSLANIKATNFDIYYRKQGGTFRCRVDDGAWSTVTADGSGGLGKFSISGLADATHTIELDTTGNTGIAVLNGIRAYTPSAVGVEVLKAGNAGLDGEQLARFTQFISPIATDFSPDVVVVILSTNDYRRSSPTVDKYVAALASLVNQYRIASPNCSFLFVAPADSDGVAVRPLTDYRDALYSFCISNGYEFYNMHDEWSSYAIMKSLGMWVDDLHLNEIGASSLVMRMTKKFFD